MISFEGPNFLSPLFIFSLISSGLGIGYNILIIKSGKNQIGEVESPKLLICAGIINLVFLGLRYFIPGIIYSGPINPEFMFYLSYQIATGLIFSVPYFITFGLLFLLFGSKNREKFGSFLKIAGILWIIAYSVLAFALSGNIIPIMFILTGEYMLFTLVFIIINFALILLSVTAIIMLIIHGTKNSDSSLKIAGILLLVQNGISIVLNFVIPLALSIFS